MPKPKFSVIIVSWNALPLLKTFLPSVIATDFPSFEVVLADNASSDGSKEWIEAHYPQVVIASLDKNYGYCGGNNRAVPYTNGEWLIFLNNDVEVHPNWLHALHSASELYPTTAAFQPKLLDWKHRNRFEYSGAAGGLLDYLGYPFCRGRRFDVIEHDKGQYNDNAPILWASGAVLCIRKDTFEALGGFEESFEFHMEEIDLCWRLWRSGHEVRFVYNSMAWHLGGGSLNAISPRKTFYNFRNNWWMLQRNLPVNLFQNIVFKRLLLDAIAVAAQLVKGRFSHAKAILLAVYAAFTRPCSFIPIHPENSVPLYQHSIVLEHFLPRKKVRK